MTLNTKLIVKSHKTLFIIKRPEYNYLIYCYYIQLSYEFFKQTF